MLGQPGALSHFSTSALEGESYAYAFGGATPDHLRLLMWHAEPGETVRVDLPYPHPQVYLYRDWWIDSRSLLTEVAGLAELEASSGDSYLLAGGTLHLKLVVQEDRPRAVIDVCRNESCP